ncbi:MAG: HD domain-containing protein [Staphylococcus epidermidis]|nr:HD domain-containing protein [Staphylococcus epidermidis]
MNSRMKIKNAYEYMKSFHQHDTTGHDIAHVERVYNNACYIAKQENITDTFVIELSSLLHDTVDSKLTDEILAYDQLKQFLSTLDLSDEISQQVLYIIKHMSYRAGKNNHVKLSIDGEIVRDADRLDAMGAIGIARTMAYSGSKGRLIHDPNLKPRENLTLEEYRNGQDTAIMHFYEKLLKLKDLMNTKQGKMLAQKRHDFLELYLAEFYAEWNGKG